LWEKFIDTSPPRRSCCRKTELEKWQKLQKTTPRDHGKWARARSEKKLLKNVSQLVKDGKKLMATTRTSTVKKLEEALKLYPASFEANFELGYHYLGRAPSAPTARAISST